VELRQPTTYPERQRRRYQAEQVVRALVFWLFPALLVLGLAYLASARF
jgi:hypothetical protein